jgi:hypothetical protein
MPIRRDITHQGHHFVLYVMALLNTKRLNNSGMKLKYDGMVSSFNKFTLKSGPKIHKEVSVVLFVLFVLFVLINYYYYNYIS